MLGSLLRRVATDLGLLVYDDGCIICNEPCGKLHSLCLKCRFEMPTTRYCFTSDNPVKERLLSMTPIVEASAYLHFRTDDRWRQMIHRLKYRGEWRLGVMFGQMYGADLKASHLYDDVDIVVPVPLHLFKYLKRRYNQSEYIARGIASQLGVKVDRTTLYRRRNNPSQTLQHATDRWANVDDIFAVRHPERLRGKHVLLVDDVLTTGATLASCIRAIYAAAPDCKVSVVTLAVAGTIKA